MKSIPFKLRSGNVTPFKMMGSSPIKHHETWDDDDDAETPEVIKKHDKLNQKSYRPYKDTEAQKHIPRTTDPSDKSGLEGGGSSIISRWGSSGGGAEGVEEKYKPVTDPEGGKDASKMIKTKEGYPVGSKEYFKEKSKEQGYSIWNDEEFKKRLRDPNAEHFSNAEIFAQQQTSKEEFRSGKKSWRGEELPGAWDPTGKSKEEIRQKQLELQRQGYNIDYTDRDGNLVTGDKAADGDLGGASSKTRQALAKQAEKGGKLTDEQRGYDKFHRNIRNRYKKDDPETTNINEGTQLTGLSKVARWISPMSSEERRAVKIEKLQQKEETARSKGGIGVSFGLLRGFTREPRSDILQRRIDKLSAKQETSVYKQDRRREGKTTSGAGNLLKKISKRIKK